VRFGSPDFIVTMEKEVAQAPAAVQPLHSTGLDAIVEALEELQLHAPEAHVPGSDRLLGFDYGRLERQLDAFLRPRPSREELRYLTFSFANAMMQLAGGEPLSLEHLTRGTPAAFPFGLRNATGAVGHLVAQHMHPSPMNDEFVGMTEYVAESFHNLLVGDLESLPDSDSRRGSHHPSRECFMVGTPEGHIESIYEEEATPTNDLDDEAKGYAGPRPVCGWSS